MRIFRSLKFRYEYYHNRKKQKRIELELVRHKAYMKTIRTNQFSIISSNCWGGSVYEDLKLPYQTPTIGLFFYAPCFLEFIVNLKKSIKEPLIFSNISKYPEANTFRKNKFDYPIGKLDKNIEIHFLHYRSEEEAIEKWNRRKKRINWDKIFISCVDRDGMTEEMMKKFDLLKYEKKIIFTSKRFPTIKNSCQLESYKKNNMVGDLYNQRYYVTKDFDLKKWLTE